MSNPAINTNVRLFDLVRYMRAELHVKDLITDEEYAWLCAEAPMANDPKGGSPSPRRLEDYDRLRANLAALRHDLSVAQNWAEHHSKHADDLIAENVALRATWSGWFEVVDGAERLAAFPKYSLAKDYADGTAWEIRPVVQMTNGGAK